MIRDFEANLPVYVASAVHPHVISSLPASMQNFVRDILLSYCPAAVRQTLRPESTLRTLHAATWSGLAQLLLAGAVLLIRLVAYFALRAHQLSPQLAGSNETGQAVISVVVLPEYLIHPLSLFLLYLAAEGFLRFVGGFVTNEVIPSSLIFLGFKVSQALSRSHSRRRSAPPLTDCLDYLPEGRVRIAADRAKAWNANTTIGLKGEWFEVEREESASPPRPFVYILRPVTPGKILRGFHEYDVTSALSSGTGTEKTEK